MSATQHASSHPFSDSFRSGFDSAMPSLPVSVSTSDLSQGRSQVSPTRPGPLSLPSESVFTALNAIIPSNPGILSPLRPPGDAIPIRRDVALTPQRRFKSYVPSPAPAASATGVLSLANGLGVQALFDIRSARHQSTPIQSRAHMSPSHASLATPGPPLVAASLRESESVSLAASRAIEQAAQTVRAIGRAEIRSGAAPPASLFSHAQAAAVHSSPESHPRHRLAAMDVSVAGPASSSSAALSDSWLLSADADAAVSAAKRVLDAIAARKAAAVATRSTSHASPIDRIAAENQSESSLALTASRLSASIPAHPPAITIEPMAPGPLANFEDLGDTAVEEPLIQEPISVSPAPTKQANSPSESTYPDALSSRPNTVSEPIMENGTATHCRASILASPTAPAIVFDLVSPTAAAAAATAVTALTDPAASQLAEIETSKATIRNLVDGSIVPILELSFDTQPIPSAADSPAADAPLQIEELVLLTDRMYEEDARPADSFHPAADEKVLQQINHIATQIAAASALSPVAPSQVASSASRMYTPDPALQETTVQLRLPTIAPTGLSTIQNLPRNTENLQWHAEPISANLERRRPLGHLSTRVADRQRSLSQWIASQSRTFGPPATGLVSTAAHQSTVATASPLSADIVGELGTPNLAATRIRMRGLSRFRSIGVDLEKVDSAPSRPAAPFLSASADLSTEIVASFFESKAAILLDKTRKQYTPASNAFHSNMGSEIQSVANATGRSVYDLYRDVVRHRFIQRGDPAALAAPATLDDRRTAAIPVSQAVAATDSAASAPTQLVRSHGASTEQNTQPLALSEPVEVTLPANRRRSLAAATENHTRPSASNTAHGMVSRGILTLPRSSLGASSLALETFNRADKPHASECDQETATAETAAVIAVMADFARSANNASISLPAAAARPRSMDAALALNPHALAPSPPPTVSPHDALPWPEGTTGFARDGMPLPLPIDHWAKAADLRAAGSAAHRVWAANDPRWDAESIRFHALTAPPAVTVARIQRDVALSEGDTTAADGQYHHTVVEEGHAFFDACNRYICGAASAMRGEDSHPCHANSTIQPRHMPACVSLHHSVVGVWRVFCERALAPAIALGPSARDWQPLLFAGAPELLARLCDSGFAPRFHTASQYHEASSLMGQRTAIANAVDAPAGLNRLEFSASLHSSEREFIRHYRARGRKPTPGRRCRWRAVLCLVRVGRTLPLTRREADAFDWSAADDEHARVDSLHIVAAHPSVRAATFDPTSDHGNGSGRGRGARGPRGHGDHEAFILRRAADCVPIAMIEYEFALLPDAHAYI